MLIDSKVASFTLVGIFFELSFRHSTSFITTSDQIIKTEEGTGFRNSIRIGMVKTTGKRKINSPMRSSSFDRHASAAAVLRPPQCIKIIDLKIVPCELY